MVSQRILVAIDGSEAGETALNWTLKHLKVEDTSLDVVTVLPPVALNVYPVAPVATSAAIAAVAHQWEAQKQHDEAHATEVLRAAVHEAIAAGVPRKSLHAHALPAAGGASGVGDSLVEFSKAKAADILVLGSRGMGALQRSLMGLVGLGSVSDYAVHQLHSPVIVVHAAPAAALVAAAGAAAQSGTAEGPPSAAGAPAAAGAAAENGQQQLSQQGQDGPPPRVVCVAVDDSVHSQHALSWAATHLLRPGDDVRVLVVALPVPYPVLDEASASVAMLEAQQWRASTEASTEYASALASRAADALALAAAAAGMPSLKPTPVALLPAGGASDVGASICKYAQEHAADLLCVGSRGMGSFKRSLMGFVGLGSVSDYCVHNLGRGAVAVVKVLPEQLPPAAASSGAGEHALGAAADVNHAVVVGGGGGGDSGAATKED